jgi:hypothetical protein
MNDLSDNESDNESDNGYKVIVSKTNKDHLYQPACCMNDVLPMLPFSAIVVGKSGSGKTMAMTSMLKNPNMLKDCFDFIFFFTGSKPDKEIIKDLKLKKDCIKVDFNEEDVKDIIVKLEKYIEEDGFNENTPSTLFIFDDILGNTDFLKSKTMTKLATANRHINVTFFLLSQYYKKIPPVIRTNCSYLMFFPSNHQEVEKLADEMCPPRMNKKRFIEYVNHATSDKHSFLGINNKSEKRLRKNFDLFLS